MIYFGCRFRNDPTSSGFRLVVATGSCHPVGAAPLSGIVSLVVQDEVIGHLVVAMSITSIPSGH